MAGFFWKATLLNLNLALRNVNAFEWKGIRGVVGSGEL
jgi:hypothetical protein